MPYRSEAQRGFMHAKHPKIAARWDKKYGGKIVPSRRKGPRRTRSPLLEEAAKGLRD